ncbi:T4SS guanine nucleotide exchange effector RalF [Legionella sp. km535]|uniref:T4SS guanine nucleotide exchange effector RalF n=1 Tax=Legionella sp. km535 TaxID=2498107 RepID=UPI001F1F4BA0|nr:T4SS guanine nucleotide exchange effector RalF [Legionella sp. km535]
MNPLGDLGMHPKITTAQREIVEAFNIKPKNGIQKIKDLLVGEEEVQVEEEIAEFFIKQKQNLDLEAVGDYLSLPDAESQAVLSAFTPKLDFGGQSFITGLRTFLKAFKLPGEAQKIGRLVESFSQTFCEQNPGVFINSDAAYLLSFQAIMLHTDMHNPSIAEKNKMTFEALVKNVRGCNDGQDFDRAFLQEMYDQLKKEPFELNFVKINPGYEFHSSILGDDPTFIKLDLLLQSTANPKGVFPHVSADVKASVDKPSSWLNVFTGYEGTLTLTDDSAKASATIQVYKPGILSKWLFGEQPRIIIQPVKQDGIEHRASIDLAAKIAADFQSPVSSIKATYNNDLVDLIDAYDASKSALKTEASKAFASTWKSEIGEEREAIKQDDSQRTQMQLK